MWERRHHGGGGMANGASGNIDANLKISIETAQVL
jgi:hypothetical protein